MCGINTRHADKSPWTSEELNIAVHKREEKQTMFIKDQITCSSWVRSSKVRFRHPGFSYCYELCFNTAFILTYNLIYPIQCHSTTFRYTYIYIFCSIFNDKHQIPSHVNAIIFLYRKPALGRLRTLLAKHIYNRQWHSPFRIYPSLYYIQSPVLSDICLPYVQNER